MCGISGVWKLKANSIEPNTMVSTMLEKIIHRGPDSFGIWNSEDKRLSLGHRRLAIQDLSPLGHQPMLSNSGRYTIVFNGEIYNFKTLLKELSQLGYAFKGHSDTEVILAAVEQWGLEQTLQRLTGMFAFAIYDKAEEHLYVARDRMGEKPLYLYLNDASFIFSSELKSITSVIHSKMKMNFPELGSYFRYGYFSPTSTPFNDVVKLKPGHYIKVDMQILTNHKEIDSLLESSVCYWNNSSSTHSQYKGLSDAKILSQFDGLLQTAVQNQSIADVDVGVFLSGGIDSSLVASVLQNNSETAVNTYTIAFNHPSYNEAPFAKDIANHLGTNHTEIPLSLDECLHTVETLPDLLDEPFADASIIPTYLVSREARKHVTVCLSGDGGDELFAGYNRYLSGNKFLSLSKKLPSFIRKGLGGVLQNIPLEYIDAMYSPISSFISKAGKTPDKDIGLKLHKIARLLLSDNAKSVYVDLLSFWRNSPISSIDELSEGYYEGISKKTFENGFVISAMLNDQNFYLPCDNLFKVDRAAMANSLEVRLPLLDHNIVEFANSLPLNFKVREGNSKWLMRKLLYKHVPKSLIERPKMGFSMPLNSWLRNEMKSWAQKILMNDDLLSTSGLNKDVIQRAWLQHQSGKRDNANALWSVISYLIWFEKFESTILR